MAGHSNVVAFCAFLCFILLFEDCRATTTESPVRNSTGQGYNFLPGNLPDGAEIHCRVEVACHMLAQTERMPDDSCLPVVPRTAGVTLAATYHLASKCLTDFKIDPDLIPSGEQACLEVGPGGEVRCYNVIVLGATTTPPPATTTTTATTPPPPSITTTATAPPPPSTTTTTTTPLTTSTTTKTHTLPPQPHTHHPTSPPPETTSMAEYTAYFSTTSPPAEPVYLSCAALSEKDGCRDRIARDFSCDQLPDICASEYAQTLCPKHCGLCGCEDHLEDGLTCEDMMATLQLTKEQLCAETVGSWTCAKFCGCPNGSQ